MWQASGDRERAEMARARNRERDEHIAAAVTMLAAAAILAALWPLAVTAAAAFTTAWVTGAHPARIARAAAWSTPVTGIYVLAATWQDRPWQPGHARRWERQPYTDWRTATVDLIHGTRIPAALLTVAPLAIPAGIAIGAALWAWRSHLMTNGLMGSTAIASVSWDNRQWRRQAATARRDARQPGRVPLLTPRGAVTVGTVIRTIRTRWARVLSIPVAEFSRHMVIVGSTGSGKTTLMIRLWAGWTAATMAAHHDHDDPRPLLVVLDCKGGQDSRAKARETRAALTAAGPLRYAVWPDVPLCMWHLPPRELATLLHQLIEHGEGSAAYYSDISNLAVTLAVTAPKGPPRSTQEFLTRLSPGWLEHAYATGRPTEMGRVNAVRQHLPDVTMRYRALLDRLGGSLDGQAEIGDADVWYCILEGTAEPTVAEVQAMAITELVARAATSHGSHRKILLAADDYSAISRRVPLTNLYERGRSLGLGVQVSAQSWEGLGSDDDERRRIASTADGGIFVLRTPSPENLVTLAGTVTRIESGRKLLGSGRTGDEGTSRVAHTWTVDPDRIRQLGTGQAAHIRHGGATFVQVSPAATPAPHVPRQAPDPQPADSDQDTTPIPNPAWPNIAPRRPQ